MSVVQVISPSKSTKDVSSAFFLLFFLAEKKKRLQIESFHDLRQVIGGFGPSMTISKWPRLASPMASCDNLTISVLAFHLRSCRCSCNACSIFSSSSLTNCARASASCVRQLFNLAFSNEPEILSV